MRFKVGDFRMIIKVKAFSLIELIVVVAVIGILVSVSFPVYTDYIARAKISKGISTIEPYIKSAMVYYAKNGNFPEANVLFTPELSWSQGGGYTSGVMSMESNEVSMIEYDAYPHIGFPQQVVIGVGFNNSFTGGTGGQWQDKKLFFILLPQADGTIKISCGDWQEDHAYNLPDAWVPPSCTETGIYDTYSQ